MTGCFSVICLFSIAPKEIRSSFCAPSRMLSGSPINIKVYGFASNKTCCSHQSSLSPKLLSMSPCNSTIETNLILWWCVMSKEVTMLVILSCSKQVETHWNSGKQSKHLKLLSLYRWVHYGLSSRVLFRKMKIKMYKTIILLYDIVVYNPVAKQ